MKKIKLSFLFLCLVFICIYSKQLKAQKKNDSLKYYYNLYTKSKEGSNLYKIHNFYTKHKEISLKKKDTIGTVYDLTLIALIQLKLGIHIESELSAIEALKLLDHLKITPKNSVYRVSLYNHLGVIYRNARNYNRALEYYNKSLALTTRPKYRNIIINNIGFAYKEQKKYKEALLSFTKTYENSVKINNKKQIARALSNLGFVKFKLKHADALPNLLEALEIRKNKQYIPGIVSSYLHLSEYYKDKNQRQKALFYANKVLAIGKEQQNTNYQVDALSLIIGLDTNSKVIEYKKLTDSIAIAKQINENKFAAIKYDFSKEKIKTEEAKLKLLESQLQEEKEKKSKILSQAIAGFILLLLFSSYFIFSVKYKKGKLEQIYKTETRISRKVHDEVANDVYHVMTKLQSNTGINEDVLDELEGIYNKTRDISKENSALDMGVHFNELLSDLLISYKNNAISVITKNISKVNWNKVSNEKKTAIYRTLQELMTNMKKHSNATFVVLVFNQKNNKIFIDFKDNGIGCNLKKNTGLQNVENRIKTANGTITFDTEINKGFSAKITI